MDNPWLLFRLISNGVYHIRTRIVVEHADYRFNVTKVVDSDKIIIMTT